MTRTAKKTNVAVSLAEAQQAANEYSRYSVQKDKLNVALNEQLNAVRQKYEPGITELDEAMAEPVAVLESYAIEQRGQWGDRKSTELGTCIIGFRTSPPSLQKARGITWDYIIALMRSNKVLKPFLRVKEDVDKQALLKLQQDAKIMKQLTAIGVTVKQDENFYVEPKKDVSL